jgi:hypothetical protein
VPGNVQQVEEGDPTASRQLERDPPGVFGMLVNDEGPVGSARFKFQEISYAMATYVYRTWELTSEEERELIQWPWAGVQRVGIGVACMFGVLGPDMNEEGIIVSTDLVFMVNHPLWQG